MQNFNLGSGFNCSGCALSVHGAIAQRWRGPVATAAAGATDVASGYLRDYVYDTRLRFLTPPYFIEPERSPWQRVRWAELQGPPAPCGVGQTPDQDRCLPT